MAALVLSTVARGRLAGLDTSAAETAPGVHRVLGYEDLPRLNSLPSPPLGHSVLPMQGPVVRSWCGPVCQGNPIGDGEPARQDHGVSTVTMRLYASWDDSRHAMIGSAHLVADGTVACRRPGVAAQP